MLRDSIMAKESIPFMKYPVLHQLENYHGVQLVNTILGAV